MKTAIMKDVLKALEKDARLAPEKIATMTGHALADVRGAIRRAEEERILLKYKAVINWDRMGREEVSALIEVKVIPQRGVGFDTVAQRIYRYPEARSVYLMSGAYDLMVEVTGKTIQQVASFVTEKLATLEFVQGTATHFMLKRFKEDGEILEVPEEMERLPISP
ncbi:MAG: Lrp/AsnC family transcriptional regulator [Dehalococcoidia bacterium]|nr:Lrp/AsnC family transcriptional regulator [Dehalococcoidia bacterium]